MDACDFRMLVLQDIYVEVRVFHIHWDICGRTPECISSGVLVIEVPSPGDFSTSEAVEPEADLPLVPLCHLWEPLLFLEG